MAKKKVVSKENEIGEFYGALETLVKEKGIDQDVFIAEIKNAILKGVKTAIENDEKSVKNFIDSMYKKSLKNDKEPNEKKEPKKDAEAEENTSEAAQAEPEAVEETVVDSVIIDIDLEKQIFNVSILKEIIEEVDELYEPYKEIPLEEARKIDASLDVGDKVRVPLDTHQFKRVVAKKVKELIRQGLSTIEQKQISETWGMYENEAVAARVVRVEPGTHNAEIEINGKIVNLMKSEQIPGEVLVEDQIVQVYVTGVVKEYKEGIKKQNLKITRRDKGLIKRLFEKACPEIYDGTVEIKSISRLAGARSKIAVMSNDPNVDAVGACIGPVKSRINAVTKEINGEKVDIVLYSDDPVEFIKQALKPAEVVDVVLKKTKVVVEFKANVKTNGEENVAQKNVKRRVIRPCVVVVPDSQLSLAIGNKGQNALLAAKLTGFTIDIKSESKVTPEDLVWDYVPEEPEAPAEAPADATAASADTVQE